MHEKLNSRIKVYIGEKSDDLALSKIKSTKTHSSNVEMEDKFDKNVKKEDNIHGRQRIKIQQMDNLCL